MSQVQTASVSNYDPGYPKDAGSVQKTTNTRGEGDTVTVDAFEDGDDPSGNEMVVLKVNCDGRADAQVQGDGSVRLNASGRGVDEYLELELTSSDPNNWTVNLYTSGGSSYTFTKGRGGAGH